MIINLLTQNKTRTILTIVSVIYFLLGLSPIQGNIVLPYSEEEPPKMMLPSLLQDPEGQLYQKGSPLLYILSKTKPPTFSPDKFDSFMDNRHLFEYQKTIIMVWEDGTVVWSLDIINGGEPYFIGKISPSKIKETMRSIRQSGYLGKKHEYCNYIWGSDLHTPFTTLGVLSKDQSTFCIYTGHEKEESRFPGKVTLSNGLLLDVPMGKDPIAVISESDETPNSTDYIAMRIAYEECKDRILRLTPKVADKEFNPGEFRAQLILGTSDKSTSTWEMAINSRTPKQSNEETYIIPRNIADDQTAKAICLAYSIIPSKGLHININALLYDDGKLYWTKGYRDFLKAPDIEFFPDDLTSYSTYFAQLPQKEVAGFKAAINSKITITSSNHRTFQLDTKQDYSTIQYFQDDQCFSLRSNHPFGIDAKIARADKILRPKAKPTPAPKEAQSFFNDWNFVTNALFTLVDEHQHDAILLENLTFEPLQITDK